eukprot:8321850-Alexandrium_andersonii.AAC.1
MHNPPVLEVPQAEHLPPPERAEQVDSCKPAVRREGVHRGGSGQCVEATPSPAVRVLGPIDEGVPQVLRCDVLRVLAQGA